MTYVLLAAAIASEVAATVCLKLADGFSRLIPSVVVVVGYLASFAGLSAALRRGLGVGLAYGIWSAAGTAAVAGIGVVFLGERLTAVQVCGVGLVIAGVLALELGRAR